MKLVVAVVQGRDADHLLATLAARGFEATRIDSTGGFLRERNATIFVGVQEQYLEELFAVINQTCHARMRFVNPLMPIAEGGDLTTLNPVEVEVCGATVFTLAVRRFERIA